MSHESSALDRAVHGFGQWLHGLKRPMGGAELERVATLPSRCRARGMRPLVPWLRPWLFKKLREGVETMCIIACVPSTCDQHQQHKEQRNA